MFNLGEEIRSILVDYVARDSITGTEKEQQVDDFFSTYISSIDYFRTHPDLYASETIPNDPIGRKVHWALVKGRGQKTVVLIHHCDVVTAVNYNEFLPYAFSPEKLEHAFLENPGALDSEAADDLHSGQWIFGRGTADMKGGGAVQLALLKEFAFSNSFPGNIILLIVPDEENLSAGMRHGVRILKRLKNQHYLYYCLMINSEPHQRIKFDKGVISQGSIAKMNFFVHIKGILTHAGKVLEGINPVGIMSRIVSRTELSLEFVDEIKEEMSIPPTWIHLKDLKTSYDISTPESIIGYMNLLNFSTPPGQVMAKLNRICKQESENFLTMYRSVYKEFRTKTNREAEVSDWKVNVLTFDELLELVRGKGEGSYSAYEEVRDQITSQLKHNELSLAEANRLLLDHMLKIINLQEIFIVIGLTPPFYPAVSNVFQKDIPDYLKIVYEFTQGRWGQEYLNRNFFTGISDLSYSSLNYDLDSTVSQMNNMPFWDHFYSIPFEDIRSIQMPCVNIGPWGKDFHKISERVFREDLLERTPLIIKNLVKSVLE